MIFSLLYIPIVVGSYFYLGVQYSGAVLMVLSLMYGAYGWKTTRTYGSLLPVLIAFFLGAFAFLSSDFLSLKLFPLILSLLFFFYFVISVISKRYVLIGWIEKFKKRPLDELERADVIVSHWFWIAVLGLNSTIHALLIIDSSIKIWALYSFVGWYLLFGCAMVLQVLFAHRRDLGQWGRNIWGYGLFAGVIVMGFIPAIMGYVWDSVRHHPKPHHIFQRVTAAMFRIFFTYAPGTATIQLIKSDAIDPNSPYIYAASHESWLDYPLMGAYVTDLYHLTNKKEAFVWIIRPIAILLGVIDGVGGNSLHKLLQKLRIGSNVLVFPEGSRSCDGEIHPFKRGAFSLSSESGIAIIPVIISGTRHLVRKGSMNWSATKGVIITITMLSPMKIADNESVEEFTTRVHALMIQYQKSHNG